VFNGFWFALRYRCLPEFVDSEDVRSYGIKVRPWSLVKQELFAVVVLILYGRTSEGEIRDKVF